MSILFLKFIVVLLLITALVTQVTVENLMHPKGGVWYFNSFYEAREEAILKIFKMYI